MAATGVGKDWDKMYLTLPFNPPRTPMTRSHDLEGERHIPNGSLNHNAFIK